ncbi:SWIM zinc finger family protein [uncultured Paludibaculum sp.]|uniref:SWIM zinc finger family protein n=1 Tax=uncultured Paludibaculum sp. TaxID=1765020 RepID=UPI002AAB3BA4|nr:SWIM zinc finger family protein [uncultured Paludibaculum sp.]
MRYDDWGWAPYVPVAVRRRNALREMEKRRKQGHPVSPVTIEGRTIARTFWGKAWCDNLERYSDYANRLPRGRTYVRNGSVVNLELTPGQIHAHVAGSDLYEVILKVTPVAKTHWNSLCADCAGTIDSLVELLQGRLSKGVMERICRQGQGLFPAPSELKLSCDCPDGAHMCKHVAAVLYGVGARLDHQPELLFLLRGVDEKDLIASASKGAPLSSQGPASGKILGDEDLSALFGLDMAEDAGTPPPAPKPAKRATPVKRPAVKKTAGRKAVKKAAKKAAKKAVSQKKARKR